MGKSLRAFGLAVALTVGVTTMTAGLAGLAGAAGAPGKASYNKKVNAMCVGYRDQFKSLNKQLSNNATLSQIAAAITKVIPKLKGEVGQIAAVPKPKSEAAALTNAYKLLQQELSEMSKLVSAVKSGSDKKIKAILISVEKTNDTANQKLAAVGLSTCIGTTTTTTTTSSSGSTAPTGSTQSTTATGTSGN